MGNFSGGQVAGIQNLAFDTTQVRNGDILSATESAIVIATPENTVLSIFGNFDYPGGGFPTGPITGYRLQTATTAPQLIETLSGVSVDFNTAIRLIGRGDGAGFNSLFFAGNDTITGTRFGDSLSGFGGNDNISGNSGNDRLSGSSGNDTLAGGLGNDSLSGSTGIDTASYAAATARVSVNLSTGRSSGAHGIDTLTGIENITGSSFADSLTGNTLSNRLDGVTGNDTSNGGGGNDILSGGTGNDALRGDTGNDTLNGGAGGDTLTGGAGNDRFLYDTDRPFRTVDVGVDIISDFSRVAGNTDKIVLSRTTFNAGTSFASVVNDAAAATSGAFITYSRTTGDLFYNQNGTATGFGTGARFATLDISNMFATDFSIVA